MSAPTTPKAPSLNILTAILGERVSKIEFTLIVSAPGSGGTSRIKALDLACFEGDKGGRLAPIVCIDVSALADTHRENGTTLGMVFNAMHKVREAGGMYLDWPVLFAVADRIHSIHVGTGKIRAVIRGIPRSEGQRDEVLALIRHGFKVTLMEFDVNEAQRQANLESRACEKRKDDNPDVYAGRVAEYHRVLPFVHEIRDYLKTQGLGAQYHYHATPAEGASIERDMRFIIEQLELDGDIPDQLMGRLFDEATEAGRWFMPIHRKDIARHRPTSV